MKRILSLVLSLLLLLSLCACGEAPAAQDAVPAEKSETGAEKQEADGEQETDEEPEPVYIRKDQCFLVRKIEKSNNSYRSYSFDVKGRALDSVTEYVYDESGSLIEENRRLVMPDSEDTDIYEGGMFEDGEEREGFTYSYDSSGKLTRVCGPKMYDEDYLVACSYEDGRMVSREIMLDPEVFSQEGTVESYLYEYDAAGQVIREDATCYGSRFYGWYKVPMTDLYEFDGEGYISHWFHTEEGYQQDVRCEYDSMGSLVKMTKEVNDKDPTVLELVNDEAGHPVSAVETSADGAAVEYTFTYDEDGRPVRYEAVGEAQTLLLTMTYGEDGYITSMERTINGVQSGKTVYNHRNWTTKINGEPLIDGSIRVSFEDSFPEGKIFGGAYQMDTSIDRDRRDDKGVGYTDHYTYDIRIMGKDLCYVSDYTRCDYELRPVVVEADPELLAAASDLQGAEELYPDLLESYGGYAPPTPDGSKRLVKVIMECASVIPVVCELSYDEHGKLVERKESFDGVAGYRGYVYEECDEQGRLSAQTYNRGKDNEYRVEYVYADDGQSYRKITIWPNDTYEQEVRLDNYHIADWVKRSEEEKDPDSGFGYDNDGMVVKMVVNGEYTSQYAYDYLETDDGTLSVVKGVYNDWDASRDLICFDSNGYLSDYQAFPDSLCSFHYIYEYVQ